jgi:branched-chain amino acid transport system substrate-binding protein
MSKRDHRNSFDLIDRRGVIRALALLPILPAISQASAQAATKTIRFGILSDFSNIYSTAGGLGLVAGAKLAVEDFLKESSDPGFKVEIVYADHQQKADVGAAIAKQWYEQDGVDAVVDVVNSAVAFAVVDETRKHNKVALIGGSGSVRLTGDLCTPNTIHWTYDTYEVGNAIGRTITEAGGKTWFFITADYAFGKDLQAATAKAVVKAGGDVIGEVRVSINQQDMSSFLLQAQASGADVVGFADAGADLVTALKQAREFGLAPTQRLAAINANIVDIESVGLEAAQGSIVAEPFYWDMNDSTRAWTKRFEALYSRSYPTLHHAGAYAMVLHYLRAAKVVGNTEGDKIVAQMKLMPTHDGLFSDGYIRKDGRVIHDIYVFKVKSPAQSKVKWDDYALEKIIPGEAAFRPLNEGGCPLIK